MEVIERTIRDYARNSRVRFVFPSEVVRDFWIRESLLISGEIAVESSRFIAWDRFKEKQLHEASPFQAVNDTIRLLFAASLLRRNAKSAKEGFPLIKSFISPDWAEYYPSFTLRLAKTLTELNTLMDRDLPKNDPWFLDLRFIYGEYCDFLGKRKLFEPGWQKQAWNPTEAEFIIFFPELIEDFSRYESLLSEKARVRQIRIPESLSVATLSEYDSGIAELRSCLVEIEALLEKGIDPRGIAISCAGIEDYAERIVHEAELRQIPLDYRQGKPLSKYPAGRLYGLIQNCAQEGFSFSSLKALLLNPVFPWKKRELCENLIQYGITYKCVSNYSSTQGMVDVWLESFKECRNEPELRAFYQKIKTDVGAITKSKSFASLLTALRAFNETHFDPQSWDDESNRVIARCMEELDDIAKSEKLLDGIDVDSPLSLFCESLGQRVYVSDAKKNGVKLYPYRVACGVFPEYHFVLGLNQEGAKVEYRDFHFIPEDRLSSMRGSKALSADAGKAFIMLYGLSGKEVRLSSCRESFAGFAIPHGLFTESGKVVRAALKETHIDRLREEKAWWAGQGEFPTKLYAGLQKTGKELFLTFGDARGIDISRENIQSDSLKKEIVAALSTEDGLIDINATSLKKWQACPFYWYLSYALKIEEESDTPEFLDAMAEGSLYHWILGDLFEAIREEDGRYRSANIERYQELLDTSVRNSLRKMARENGCFMLPVLRSFKKKIRENLANLLVLEDSYFDGASVKWIEQKLETKFPDLGVHASGRIDRVSQIGQGLIVIDYKKTKKDTKADKEAQMPDERGLVGEPQLPFYAMLIEEKAESIDEAAYIGIENQELFSAFSDTREGAWHSLKDLQKASEAVKIACKNFAEAIKKGDFKRTKGASCMDCDARQACRASYRMGRLP